MISLIIVDKIEIARQGLVDKNHGNVAVRVEQGAKVVYALDIRGQGQGLGALGGQVAHLQLIVGQPEQERFVLGREEGDLVQGVKDL